MLLFKDEKMCSTRKSAFKTFLLKNVKEADPTKSKRIIGRDARLWFSNWKRNETFEKGFEKC